MPQRSLAYSLGGSLLWETAGETTPPSLNDHINTAIGGAFIGEAAFRMASLLLEGSGERPGFWRELGAAILSPPTGFNRLVFGDRFDAVFPSRNPEIFIRPRLGATLTYDVDNDIRKHVKRQEGSADYSITYGLPGKPGYEYKRPFDYFHFEFTAVPNASHITDAIENVSIRGLLGGRRYTLGDDFRGGMGRLRQLRLLLTADLPGVEHRGVDGYRLPVVALAPRRAAGHRPRRDRTRRGGHRRRPGRARVSLRAGAADPARGSAHLRGPGDAGGHRAPVLRGGNQLEQGDRGRHQPLQPGRDSARQRRLHGAPLGAARPRGPVPRLESPLRGPRPARPASVGANRHAVLQLPRPHPLRRGGVAPRPVT